MHGSDCRSETHVARRSVSTPDEHSSEGSAATTSCPIAFAQVSRSPNARFVPTLLHAAWRSQRAIVTRITALSMLTGVAAVAVVSFMVALGPALELVVNAALVVVVLELGAGTGRRSAPLHAVPAKAVATTSTTVVPRNRCMTRPPASGSCITRTSSRSDA